MGFTALFLAWLSCRYCNSILGRYLYRFRPSWSLFHLLLVQVLRNTSKEFFSLPSAGKCRELYIFVCVIRGEYTDLSVVLHYHRPYDLGDRIYMHDPSVVNCNGLDYSWFVEGE